MGELVWDLGKFGLLTYCVALDESLPLWALLVNEDQGDCVGIEAARSYSLAVALESFLLGEGNKTRNAAKH